MVPTALDRFLRTAAGTPSEARWAALFRLIGEWPEDAATAETWTARADAALAPWPTYLRAAVLSDYDLEDHQAWMWGLGPETEPVPWLRLVRSLWAAVPDLLAVPPDGGWAGAGFAVIAELHLQGTLSAFSDIEHALPRLPALSTLDLAAVPLDRTSCEQLAASPCVSALRGLDLSSARGPGLTDEMIAPVTRSEHLRALAVLRLADNALTDDAVELLLDARFAPALVELDLRRNQLTAAASERFTRRPRPPRLQRLHLAGNRLTAAALAAIARWGDGVPGFAATLTD